MIRADLQIEGKGRLGRQWTSEHGNLYTTLLLPSEANLQVIPQLGFVVALAAYDTVKKVVSPKLKWPNDCLVDGAKIAGVLCEVVSQNPVSVALGCGINIAHAPGGLAYPATCLSRYSSTTVEQTYLTYAENLKSWLAIWNNGLDFPHIRQAWVTRAIGIGEEVILISQAQTHRGTMVGIDASGALVLSDANGNRVAHRAGDLIIPSLTKLRERI